MIGNRGDLEVESLLKIVLVLVVAWVALAVANLLIRATFGLLYLLAPVIGLAIAVLIALWLLDRI